MEPKPVTTITLTALSLYEEINSIKTEAPTINADWERLAIEARNKRLEVIQLALDKAFGKGYEKGISYAAKTI